MFSGFRRDGMTATARVALAQGVLAPVVASVGALIGGPTVGVALLYGGLVGFAVNAVLVWREAQSMRHPEWDQHRLFKQFIRVGIERLVLLVSLLAAGFGLLRLAPLPLLLGLMLAQAAWLVAAKAPQR